MNVRIPYKPSLKLAIITTALFGGAATLFYHLASTANTTLSLFHIIALDIDNSVIAFWILMGVSSLFVIVGIYMFIISLISEKEITFYDEYMTLPERGLYKKSYLSIPYSSIYDVKEISINGTYIFYIYYDKKQYTLSTSMLPGKKVYAQFKNELFNRVEQNHKQNNV